jgi:hypothetical protein
MTIVLTQLYISDSPVNSTVFPFSAQDVFPLADEGYCCDVWDRVGAIQSHSHITAVLCCGFGHCRIIWLIHTHHAIPMPCC